MKDQLWKFVKALGLLVASLVIGTSGFVFIEGFTVLNAFYMAVITLSTVGFGEIHELSENGRLFTALYIIFNLAIFAYIISVFASYFFEGKLKLIFKNIMDDRQIHKLQDHVIVCGYGRNGSEACEHLLKKGKDIVVIDNDPSVRDIVNGSNHLKLIIADASHDKNLKLAGIERAKEIIITTSSDAANVFITLTSRELKPDIFIISRASEVESESKLYRAGANHVIMPDQLGGLFMAQMITKPVVIEFLDLLTGRGRKHEKFHLESIGYEELKPAFRDKQLGELDINRKTGATVVAVKDDVKGMIPNPSADTFIGPDDTLILLCSDVTSERLLKTLTGN